MPSMGGVDLIRVLRAQQATCPIVMVSSDTSLTAAVLALGANHFFVTPLDVAEFKQVVTALLPP
jgi:DNA-binding response OmpR family regulator